MVKQIKMKDKENDVICGGLLFENGDILCACCGSIIPKDEQDDIEILEIYEVWIDFSESIID